MLEFEAPNIDYIDDEGGDCCEVPSDELTKRLDLLLNIEQTLDEGKDNLDYSYWETLTVVHMRLWASIPIRYRSILSDSSAIEI